MKLKQHDVPPQWPEFGFMGAFESDEAPDRPLWLFGMRVHDSYEPGDPFAKCAMRPTDADGHPFDTCDLDPTVVRVAEHECQLAFRTLYEREHGEWPEDVILTLAL